MRETPSWVPGEPAVSSAETIRPWVYGAGCQFSAGCAGFGGCPELVGIEPATRGLGGRRWGRRESAMVQSVLNTHSADDTLKVNRPTS